MTLKEIIEGNIAPGNDEAALFVNNLTEDTRKFYLKQHPDWYLNERFIRGEHWIVYNKSLNSVQTMPSVEGEVRRTINKIKTQVRGVKNFVKKSQPRWEVHPEGPTNEDYEAALDKNAILQNIYRTREFPGLLTSVIVNGLKYSVGIIEGGMTIKDGKPYIDFWCDDTFDVLFDPFAPDVQSCRFIIKTLKKPLESVKNNKNYTIKSGGITADNKEASAQYKDLLEKEKYGRGSGNGGKDLDSVIVKELWVKYYDGEGKPKLKVLVVAGTKLVRVFQPAYRRYPIFIYNPEKDPNSIYSDAWVKDLISPNKSLDKTVSQIEAYIQRMLAGKYLIKQGVEVTTITDKGAEKIYYKGTTPPVQQVLQPLPTAPFSYLANLERWIEESGGVREASLGRAPGSMQSGKGVESLQAADASTVAEPIENLELMLAEIGEFSLELIEDFQITSETIYEDKRSVKYIGGVESAPEGVRKIKSSKVYVAIVPEISYTEEVKKEWLMRLAESKLIDPQTLLEKLSISNISEVIARMKVMQEEAYKQELLKQRESHRTDGNGPQDTADLAHQENMAMAAGQDAPLTPRSLWQPEHTDLHMSFIQSNKDAYAQNKALFDKHISAEQQYANSGPANSANNTPAPMQGASANAMQ